MNANQIKALFMKVRDTFLKNIKQSIYSVIIALVVWYLVSVTIYRDLEQTYTIPVDIILAGTSAERFGLRIVNQDVDKMTVKIEANRAVIGNMTSDDQLNLEVSSLSGENFEVVSMTPSTVTVNLDKYITSTFPVEAEAPEAQAAEGFMIGEPVASPNTVSITGPETQVSKITRCVVRTDYGGTQDPLKESHEVTTGNQLILYNENTVMDQSDLEISQTNYSISIPIYMKKTLDLVLSFTNVPTGFPIDQLTYLPDVSSIEVAAPNGNIGNVTDFTLGYMDLRKVDIGTVAEFPVTLPTGYQNLSNIQTVRVTFPSEGLARKKINIKNRNVSVINGPSNLDITTLTAGWDVTFIGPKETVESLTAQDIVAQIDLLGESIKSGDTSSFPISFFVPDKGLVWAYDSFAATVRATDKVLS